MHRSVAYLKGDYFEQSKIQTQRVTILRGKKPSPDGKIPVEIWMGGCPAILVFDRSNIFDAVTNGVIYNTLLTQLPKIPSQFIDQALPQILNFLKLPSTWTTNQLT